MSEKTLLASVVLFRELYDNQKDVYDVIAEFIKAALLFKQKWTVDATEATHLLNQEFELSIPEAVVSTTLSRRLNKRYGIVTYAQGRYTVVPGKLEDSHHLVDELERVRTQQNVLVDRLIKYIESLKGGLSEKQRADVTRCFCEYLFDVGSVTTYSADISSFIIKFQDEHGFTGQLNAVKEGFVLYDGVRHTPDLSQIGVWRKSLTVYLDTEHLFNAVGYNGALHKQLFSDFLNLAYDVRDNGARLISLRYFSESADEIDRFFGAAEQIVDGKASLDPSKPAMVAIVNGSRTRGDVLAKKAAFLTELEELGIRRKDGSVADVDPKFNLDNADLLQALEAEFNAKDRLFNEQKCVDMLQIFTKINALRNGRNDGPFESVGHVFVSGSYLSNYLAFHPKLAVADGGITRSVDLEFITNRLWFKLHKGLTKNVAQPHSLNVLAKAQVVLASQINSSIAQKVDAISNDFQAGKLRKDEAHYLLNELRAKAFAPEALTSETVASALEVIDHKEYENFLREKTLLEQRAAEGQRAIEQLTAIHEARRARKIRMISGISVVAHTLLVLFLVAIVLALFFSTYKFVMLLATKEDTPLAIFGVLCTFILGLLPLIKFRWITSLIAKSHHRLVERLLSGLDSKR